MTSPTWHSRSITRAAAPPPPWPGVRNNIPRRLRRWTVDGGFQRYYSRMDYYKRFRDQWAKERAQDEWARYVASVDFEAYIGDIYQSGIEDERARWQAREDGA